LPKELNSVSYELVPLYGMDPSEMGSLSTGVKWQPLDE
jgi:hypothetical protein